MAEFEFRMELKIDDPDYPTDEDFIAEILRNLALKFSNGIKMEYGDPTPIYNVNGQPTGEFQFTFSE